MIFVTVGTTKFQFNRLLRAVDRDWGEKLVVQKGNSSHVFKCARLVKNYFNYGEMINYFRSARVVVMHAGVGSYLTAKKHFSGIPIVVPRLKKFQEHVCDHQLMLADYLEVKKRAIVLSELEKLPDVVDKYSKAPRKINKPVANSVPRLVEYLKKIAVLKG